MKRLFVLLALGVILMPLGTTAQDDVYYIPSTKTKKVTTIDRIDKKDVNSYENETYGVSKSRNNYSETRDVDEYNRRSKSSNYSDDENYEETTPTIETGKYTKKIVRFHSPSGYIVSSPYYWDVFYNGDDVFDIYVDAWSWSMPSWGFWGYTYDPWFYDPFWHYHSCWNWTWGWHRHCYYDYHWGWHSPYYAHWGWSGFHHHHHYAYIDYHRHSYIGGRSNFRTYSDHNHMFTHTRNGYIHYSSNGNNRSQYSREHSGRGNISYSNSSSKRSSYDNRNNGRRENNSNVNYSRKSDSRNEYSRENSNSNFSRNSSSQSSSNINRSSSSNSSSRFSSSNGGSFSRGGGSGFSGGGGYSRGGGGGVSGGGGFSRGGGGGRR